MSENTSVQASRSRSSLFFERYAGAEKESERLRGLVGVLAGVCAVLTAGLVVVVTRPRPVYYIPGAVASGMAYPDQVPLQAAADFAAAWLMNWMNYTPVTIDGVYERALKWMGPALLSRIHAKAASEVVRVKEERLSSALFLEKAPQVQREGSGFRVVLKGRRGVFVGKEEMSSVAVCFTVVIQMASPSENDPYGLAVVDIQEEKA